MTNEQLSQARCESDDLIRGIRAELLRMKTTAEREWCFYPFEKEIRHLHFMS